MKLGHISAFVGGVSGAVAALMLLAAHPHATISSGPLTHLAIGALGAIGGAVIGYFVGQLHRGSGGKALWTVVAIAIFGLCLLAANSGLTTDRPGLEAVALAIAACGLIAPAFLGLTARSVHCRRGRAVLGGLRQARVRSVPGGVCFQPKARAWDLRSGRPGPTSPQN